MWTVAARLADRGSGPTTCQVIAALRSVVVSGSASGVDSDVQMFVNINAITNECTKKLIPSRMP
jgi:hypothetical protein